MIVLNYNANSVEDCHGIMAYMELPGDPRDTSLDKKDHKIVFAGSEFIALFYPDESKMELYPTKNTNSINYFINRYDKLDFDSWHLFKTKRW